MTDAERAKIEALIAFRSAALPIMKRARGELTAAVLRLDAAAAGRAITSALVDMQHAAEMGIEVGVVEAMCLAGKAGEPWRT